MIQVRLNKPGYEYDIHSLIRAFFPGEEVRVRAKEQAAADGQEDGQTAGRKPGDGASQRKPDEARGPEENTVSLSLAIDYLEHGIRIAWERNAEGMPVEEENPSSREFAVEFSDRVETKNRLKCNLYEMLSKYTKKTLPWGTLTGIRPVKLPMKLLEEGQDRGGIVNHLRQTYLMSPEKAELSLDIAERELALLKQIDYVNGYSLYVGIPFCPTTCLYCSFTSFPLSVWRERVDAYLDALERELDFVAKRFAAKHLNAVYIGGGTPTTLEPAQLERLITDIKSRFDLSCCLEFTVEAGRPDSITEEKLAVLREQGISRISINPQTMNQKTLDLIGRRHTVEQTVESFYLARRLGFDNINMDLIMGLPGETIDDVRHTLSRIRELGPDNLTVHSLALKRAARLNLQWENYKDFQMVNTQEHMDLAAVCAAEMGLSPYYLYRQKSMAGNLENVGYAAPGKAGVYNVLIMEEKQTIMAVGAGAATKLVLPRGRQAADTALPDNGQGNEWLQPGGNQTGCPQHQEKKAVPARYIWRAENVKDVALYMEKIDEMIGRKQRLMEEIGYT